MSSEKNISHKANVLLADLNPDDAKLFRANLSNHASIVEVGVNDTFSLEFLGAIDLIFLSLRNGDSTLYRISRHLGEDAKSCKVFLLGEGTVPHDIEGRLPTIRTIETPIDFGYIRGLIDSIHMDRSRFQDLGEEQSRVRGLYEISSSLLKVVNRMHIAPVLDSTLPKLLNSYMILLFFPEESHPIVYLHSPDGLPPKVLKPLKQHLQEAWDILRADSQVHWEWLLSLSNTSDSRVPIQVTTSSFMTTPISSGAQTRGFLTVLPRSDEDLDETFLQTFFVIGDLISVLLHNLELRERLEDRAMHDGLTKLLNRQTLIENLEKECRRSQRYNHSVCIVMFDIDHFKRINDKYGHQAGDEALRAVANRLRDSVREMDIAGRCGGEEFIVILVNTQLVGGVNWAERFRMVLEETSVEFGELKIPITSSFGVASACGDTAQVGDLIARADAAP